MIDAERFLDASFAASYSAIHGDDGTRQGGCMGRSDGRAASSRRDGDLDDCREAALRLLDAASRSSGALRDRLRDKGYEADVIDDVVTRLVRVGLVDDVEYARMLLRHCAARGLGARGVAAEFSRRRVDRALGESLIDDARENGVFRESALRMASAVESRTRGLDQRTRLRRLWAAAGRKGHDSDDVRSAVLTLFGE